MKNIINTDKAPAAIGPYSQAVEVGEMIFTSGIIPADPKTGEVGNTINEQTHQAFTNLKNLIEASGAQMTDIVKTTVFLSDINDFAAVNEIYKEYFAEPYPARSCVEVSRLPKDVSLEIEAIVKK